MVMGGEEKGKLGIKFCRTDCTQGQPGERKWPKRVRRRS